MQLRYSTDTASILRTTRYCQKVIDSASNLVFTVIANIVATQTAGTRATSTVDIGICVTQFWWLLCTAAGAIQLLIGMQYKLMLCWD